MKTKSGTSKKHSAHVKHTTAKAGKSSKTYYVVFVDHKGAQWFCEEEALNVYLDTVTDLYTVKEYRTSQTALKKCKEFNQLCKDPSSGGKSNTQTSVASSGGSLKSLDGRTPEFSDAKTGTAKLDGPPAEVLVASSKEGILSEDTDDATTVTTATQKSELDDPFAEGPVDGHAKIEMEEGNSPAAKEPDNKSKWAMTFSISDH